MIRKKDIINTLVLNGSLIYMSFCALVGIRFNQEDGAGPVYKVFMGLLVLLGAFSFFQGFVKRKRYTAKEILPLLFLFLYVLVGIFQLPLDSLYFLEMCCFSVPATCIALNMRSGSEIVGMMKLLDLMLPFFSAAFVFMVINIYLTRLESNEAAYDQSASYFIAFCFLIDIYLLRYKNYYQCFKFLDKKWYRVFKILLLPYFVVMAFFGGGRGAFVTILVGLICNIGVLKRLNPRKIRTGCVSIIIIALLVIFILQKLNDDYWDLLLSNFERIYALVEGGKLDTSASSGRDELWKLAFELFLESPLYGWGIFSYLSVYPMQPHNIILEVMLQGGMILLTVLVIFVLVSIGKYRKMLRIDRTNIFLMPFIIYVFTQLMFSSSYTFEPFFWFVLTYIYAYNIKIYYNEQY